MSPRPYADHRWKVSSARPVAAGGGIGLRQP